MRPNGPTLFSFFIVSLITDLTFPFSFLRFRQEYRFERKVLSDLSIDVDNHCLDSEELSNLVSTTAKCQSPSRHQISRVVVMHNDKLETFVNPSALSESKESVSGDFFDNDSFWSGSLTWY